MSTYQTATLANGEQVARLVTKTEVMFFNLVQDMSELVTCPIRQRAINAALETPWKA